MSNLNNLPDHPEPRPLTPQQSEILLYWSGELSADESRRVAALIASDAAARTYYGELQSLREAFTELPDFTPRSPVAQDGSVFPEPVTLKPVRNASRAPLLWVFGGLAAAALLLFTLPALLVPDPQPDPASAVVDAGVGVPAAGSVDADDATKVSAILFRSRTMQTRRLDHRQERQHFSRTRSLASRL